MSPYKERAEVLAVVMVIARAVVAQIDALLWTGTMDHLPEPVRVMLAVRGMLSAAVSLAISRGQTPEDVASGLEDLARRIRSGEAEAKGKVAAQEVARMLDDLGGRPRPSREPPS